MYRYILALWLSDEPLRKEVDLRREDYLKAIEVDGVEHYNTISQRSKNIKKITECKVVNNAGVSEVRITLESAAVLNIPNRALRVFSSYLANGALSELVRYGSLFRGTSEKADSPIAELTDEDLLTLLIKCVFRNTKQDRDLLLAVKDVVKSEYQD
jgi:hypothetical protein